MWLLDLVLNFTVMANADRGDSNTPKNIEPVTAVDLIFARKLVLIVLTLNLKS